MTIEELLKAVENYIKFQPVEGGNERHKAYKDLKSAVEEYHKTNNKKDLQNV